MFEWLAVAVLGVIEGLTEFLPVSSTGHLLLAEQWLPKQSELFNVVVQCGAVLAVMVVFKNRLLQFATQWREPECRDYLAKLAAAFFITGVGGLALKKLGMKLPPNAAPVAWATLVGGVLFLGVEWSVKGRKVVDSISWPVALAVGSAQLLAAGFPGTSRSGVTILFALAMGVGRPAATEFSFLLGVPTLLAAGAFEILGELRHPSGGSANYVQLALATFVAAVTAFAVVKWLLRYVQSHTFVPFAWYRIVLGAAILLWPR